ncbi:hypothetical protein [Hyperthermus butylicus]|uniref:Uncharacterized protein n=1 Tax=Hyperthermus butylicus (strain DSM 5456 / JCM 9403 / PLM1-5) TaxID=415426 RepID=A2BMN9_HYPBU|nr:hypothetical protein [Hyperthermus butylicus]ABM81250.1 hypothetical protein Hbut_1426 [Hyperthermus butylicus DSM 5456]
MARFYEAACRTLERLCPRPRPLPLLEAGLSLENIAQIDPLLLAEIAGIDVEEASTTIERLRKLLEQRSQGRCRFCNGKASRAVELWTFERSNNRKALAILEDIVTACEKCRRALYPEHVILRGGRDLRWLTKWVAKVNRVKKDIAEELVTDIVEEWSHTGIIREWSVDVSKLSNLGVPAEPIARLANMLASGIVMIRRDAFVVPNPSCANYEAYALESLEALCTEAITSSKIVLKASEFGLHPNGAAIRDTIIALMEFGACKSKTRRPSLIEGAWVVVVPAKERAKLIAMLLETMRSEMYWFTRLETPVKHVDPAPMHFYTPSFADIETVVGAAKSIEKLLSSLGGASYIELRYYPKLPSNNELSRVHIYSYKLRNRG